MQIIKHTVKVRKIHPAVQTLLKETGIDLTREGGIPELNRFQEHFRDYKIVVYQGLGCDDIMYEGQVDSSKHLNLLYDDVERHYHVKTNLTGAMAKKYVFNACHKSCRRDITHVCDQTCSDCMASLRAHSPTFASHATGATDILEVGRVSLTTSRAPQRENQYANVKYLVRRVDCFCRGKITNVISDSARTAARTDKQATCVT